MSRSDGTNCANPWVNVPEEEASSARARRRRGAGRLWCAAMDDPQGASERESLRLVGYARDHGMEIIVEASTTTTSEAAVCRFAAWGLGRWGRP